MKKFKYFENLLRTSTPTTTFVAVGDLFLGPTKHKKLELVNQETLCKL